MRTSRLRPTATPTCCASCSPRAWRHVMDTSRTFKGHVMRTSRTRPTATPTCCFLQSQGLEARHGHVMETPRTRQGNAMKKADRYSNLLRFVQSEGLEARHGRVTDTPQQVTSWALWSTQKTRQGDVLRALKYKAGCHFETRARARTHTHTCTHARAQTLTHARA